MSNDRATSLGSGAPAAGVLTGRTLILFVAVAASGVLGFLVLRYGARVALPLLPSGIAVAALVRWGRRLWPAVFAGGVAIELFRGSAPLEMLSVGVGLAAGCWLTAWLLGRWDFDPRFARRRDVPLFIAAACIGMVLPPLVGALGEIGDAARNVMPAPLRLLIWWSKVMMGVLLAGPFLIALRRESLAPLTRRPLESLLYLAVTIALCAAVVLLPTPGMPLVSVRPPLFVVALVLVVVGTIRFGLVVSSAAAFVLALVVAWSFAFGVGAFRLEGMLPGLVSLWSFVVALVGLVLIVTALLAERDAAAVEQLRAERRYAEVFEASPQPLWVHDPATLGFLLVNPATERQYGYSRQSLLGMRASDLAAPGEEHAVPAADAVPRSDGEPFETRHVTRDGRLLEVEMWTRPIDFGGRPAVLVFAADATERKALGRALIDAIAGEQRRIGQEMHDGLGQELTGLSLSTRALANRAQRDRLPFAADLDQLAALIATCIQSARRIVHGLSPLSGADGNLVMALSNLADTSSVGGLTVRLNSQLEAPLTLPLEARNHLFRIAQEALQNAQKHAGARHIDIELSVRPDAVRLAILDDGQGTPTAVHSSGGLGMRTMRYRAASIGGRLAIRPRSPHGTTVVCDAPQSTTRSALSA